MKSLFKAGARAATLFAVPRSKRAAAIRVTLMMPLAFAALAADAASDCQMEPVSIPVHMVQSRPVATVTLNGKPIEMMVDSGAFSSTLPVSTATQLGLTLNMLPFGYHISGYTGAVEAQITRVKQVGFGSAELKNIDFLVAGNELGHGIQGILGRNILALGDTEYDLAHGMVRLVFPKGDCKNVSMAYWAGDAPVIVARLADDSLDDSDDAIRLDVAVNGRKLRAFMDTGAPTTTLTLKGARKAGITEDRLTPYGQTGGLGEDSVRTWLADVDSFQFGGEKITHQRLRVDDADGLSFDMLIGLDYFLAHRIYVAREQGKVYATWNGGDVFAKVKGAAANQFDRRFAATPAEMPADDADALLRRGTAFEAAGNHERALEDLDRAIELKPTVAKAFLARARVQRSLRQYRRAVSDLDEALRLDATLVDAQAMRVGMRTAVGDAEGSLADAKDLDARLPASAAQRSGLGTYFSMLGMVPEALRQWDLWLASHDSDAGQSAVYANRCWMRARLKLDLPLAVADCKKAVAREPDDANAHENLGWAYLVQGDAPRAKAAFDRSLELNARSAFSLFGRGLTGLRLQDEAAAQRDFEAARRVNANIDKRVREEGFDVPDSVKPAKS